jgi:hypothetical protein
MSPYHVQQDFIVRKEEHNSFPALPDTTVLWAPIDLGDAILSRRALPIAPDNFHWLDLWPS